MIQKITHVPLLVRDQQEALDWFTQKLGFEVRANDPFPGDPSNRWITVAPAGQTEIELVLQPPDWGTSEGKAEREKQIGKQEGFVLASADCRRDCDELSAKGVTIISPPEELPWGVSALIADLYGNVHNILEAPTA